MNNKIADIQTQNVTYGEQGWRSTETTRPPAMWPGFGLYVIAYNWSAEFNLAGKTNNLNKF